MAGTENECLDNYNDLGNDNQNDIKNSMRTTV